MPSAFSKELGVSLSSALLYPPFNCAEKRVLCAEKRLPLSQSWLAMCPGLLPSFLLLPSSFLLPYCVTRRFFDVRTGSPTLNVLGMSLTRSVGT